MSVVFAVGTGRCASVTFYQACRHAVGRRSMHEPNAGVVPVPLAFHRADIVSSGHLFAFVPQLVAEYPDSQWVVLKRDRAACVESLVAACALATRAFWRWSNEAPDDASDVDLAGAYYDHVYASLAVQLPKAHVLDVDDMTWARWAECWDFMGLGDNFDASYTEWSRRYNSRDYRGKDSYTREHS